MENIELIVGGLIFNSRDELLAISGHKWKERYVVPGGHVERGEPPEAALHREVFEETSLDIEIVKLLGIQESLGSAFAPERHLVFIDYLCRASSSTVVPSDEAKRHRWLSSITRAETPLGEFTQRGIELYSLL